MTFDEILDTDLTNSDKAYDLVVRHGDEMLAAAAQWYLAAKGHTSARSDQFHGSMWRTLRESTRWPTLRAAFTDTWGPMSGELPPIVDPLPIVHAGEKGKVHVDGFVFRREDNSIYSWIGADSFVLATKLDQHDFVQDLLSELIDPDGSGKCKGANLVRLFATLDWSNQTGAQFDGGVGPRIGPDALPKVRRAVDICATRGLRAEVSFGDLVKLMPNKSDRIDYIHNVAAAFAGAWNVFFEFNEPGHADQVGPDEAAELGDILIAAGFLCSYGIYDVPTGVTTIKHGSYATVHGERKDEWPRTPRDCSNLYSGWDWTDDAGNVTGHFDGARVPWVDDENVGAAEVKINYSRSNNPDDFAYQAACAAMLASGTTIHFDDGLYSNRLHPVQKLCFLQFCAAAHFIPGEAKLAPYQRGAAGHDGGGFGPGFNNMPIAHFDLDEVGNEPRALRSFCKEVNGKEYCVAIRTTQDHATPRDGWIVEEELRRGVVRLRK